MSKVKRIAPRIIDDRTLSYYEENYRSLNAGGEKALKFYPTIRRIALFEIKEQFTDPEFKYMLEMMNGHVLSDLDARNEVMIAEIEYSNTLDNLAQKWKIEIDKLAEKVKKLNHLQVFFLSEWLCTFWDMPDKKFSMEKWIKELKK